MERERLNSGWLIRAKRLGQFFGWGTGVVQLPFLWERGSGGTGADAYAKVRHRIDLLSGHSG